MQKHRWIPVLLFALLQINSLYAANMAPEESEIRQVLDIQVLAWNEGDLEAFILTYRDSENLTYFSGGHPLRGRTELLSRYRRTYQSEESEMGILTFSSIEINLMGDEFALARGQWHLERKTLDNVEGLFTLVLKKFPDGWKIIHDHSSS